MAKVVSSAGKIAALDALLALINGGSGDATGDFNLQNSANTTLATLLFSATSFAAAADVAGTIKAVANTITSSSTPVPGTIAKGQFRNRANVNVITFDIATSGSDMNIADVVIPSDATSVACSGLEVSLNIT